MHTEAEALIAEQNFIKQYKPRFNIRLRDDKSYPYIAISLDEDFPRVYFTRERHRRDRAYFGPYSNAKRVRSTLEVLGKVFMFRSCEGPTPGRRSGSPCLDYYIKRCEAPCVGYVTREEYRRGIDGVIDFLSGRYREIERSLEPSMREAAAEQRFEDAARERNRLRGVHSLLERQRVATAHGHARRDRRGRRRDRGQRPGLPGPRRRARRPPELLPRQRRRRRHRRGGRGVHPPVLRERDDGAAAAGRPARDGRPRGARRGVERAPRRSGRDPRRRARRQAADPRAGRAQRRNSRSIRRSCAPSAAASSASRRSTACSRRSGSTRSRCASSASTSRP